MRPRSPLRVIEGSLQQCKVDENEHIVFHSKYLMRSISLSKVLLEPIDGVLCSYDLVVLLEFFVIIVAY